MNTRFEKRLQKNYPETYPAVATTLTQVTTEFSKKNPKIKDTSLSFSEKDMILITYADHVHDGSKKT